MTINIRFGILVFIVSITVVATLLIVYFYLNKSEIIRKPFGDFIALQEKEELVVAELTTIEVFSKEEFNFFFEKFPLGETITSIHLTAHYKYYFKLSELSYETIGDTLVLKAPMLYASLPVAFDIDTFEGECNSRFFALNCKQSLQHLKNEVNQQMPKRAKARASIVYDKAAKSLADIFYNFLSNNLYPISFSKIKVVIGEENSKSTRVFSYDANCSLIECLVK